MPARAFSEIRLVNGSTGDPGLYIDYPGKDNALLFDAGDNGSLELKRLADLEAVFITHLHVDHFIGFDRIMRANLDQDKVLHLFGPAGTIDKVYQRLTAYIHPFFPFQRCRFSVTELSPGKMRIAELNTAAQFPVPEICEQSWKGRVIYSNADLRIEAVAVEHTTACYAYALVEKAGYHLDPEKLKKGRLRPGNWILKVSQMLREEADEATNLEIDGGKYQLATLRDQYFTRSGGARVAYVTDTVWNDSVSEALLPLTRNAARLYCDSYYSIAHIKSAQKHKHMTATHAAELGKLARVDRLILMHFATRYAANYQNLIDEARAIFPRTSVEGLSGT